MTTKKEQRIATIYIGDEKAKSPIMIDIDEPAEGFSSIKEQAASVCQYLKEARIPFSCFWTGSKSYHISVLSTDLRFMSPSQAKQFKAEFLDQIGADVAKSSSNTMIALEGAPHYRSGEIKREADIA